MELSGCLIQTETVYPINSWINPPKMSCTTTRADNLVLAEERRMSECAALLGEPASLGRRLSNHRLLSSSLGEATDGRHTLPG